MKERREQLLELVSGLAESRNAAEKFASHLEELLDMVLPTAIGPEYCGAIEKKEYAKAISLCADYFRRKEGTFVEGRLGSHEYHLQTADNAVGGTFRVINIDWSFPEGKIDFLFDPTAIHGPRNHEWLWQFNRHSFWLDMVMAYQETGSEIYAKAFGKQLLTWIEQTDIPENWNGPGSAWRTIECGIRLLGRWPIAYDGFRRSPSLSDAMLLLMIASMHRQSVHLVNHFTGRNWLMMEANGVYTFSLMFPEFADSKENRNVAANRLVEGLKEQVLPDGMHDELSPDYQGVVFSCISNFYELAKSFGLSDEIPRGVEDLMRASVRAAVLLSTPGFTQPLTNDTHIIPTRSYTERAEKLLGEDPICRYVNSGRKEGAPPASETASAFLPYAGFAVMRSDWGAEASYLCFDVGPLGTAHMHQDKLNINLYKGNQELIFDDGGGQYEISDAREYAISGYGHNTVLVDGLAQNRNEPRMVTEPINARWTTSQNFDYAEATYDDAFGPERVKPAIHRREVRFEKPNIFCVVDHLSSADGKGHDYEVLFHLDTTRMKPLPGIRNGVLSDYGREYEIAILPLEDEDELVELETVSAAAAPRMRGWYVGRNETNVHKAVTVSRRVSGKKDFRFVTLLIPVKANAPLPRVIREGNGKVTVELGGKEYPLDLNSLNQ